MSDPTNAERQRRWYERQRAGTPWQPPTCQACGSPHRGAHGVLCSRCWIRLTPEGRAANAERVRLARAKKRNA